MKICGETLAYLDVNDDELDGGDGDEAVRLLCSGTNRRLPPRPPPPTFASLTSPPCPAWRLSF